MWKTKALTILENMDYFMFDIVNHGPYVPMFQPTVNNAPVGGLKQKPKARYDEEDKRIITLNVKARATIGNSLPYHIYCLVQNYEFAQEMMKTQTMAYREKSSEDERMKENCLMACIDDFDTQESDSNSNTFNTDFSQTAKECKIQDWHSSSLYQVKKFINYSSKENFAS